jgi:hypothetical protein
MGLSQTIRVHNRTTRTLEIGVEPTAMFYDVESGASLTMRTEFVEDATQLEVAHSEGVVALYLLGPTEVEDKDSLPPVGSERRFAPVDSVYVANYAAQPMRLSIGPENDVELAPGANQTNVVEAADDELELIVDDAGLTFRGWRFRRS